MLQFIRFPFHSIWPESISWISFLDLHKVSLLLCRSSPCILVHFFLCFIYRSLSSDLYFYFWQDVSAHFLLTMDMCDIDFLSLAMTDGRTHLACLSIPQPDLSCAWFWLPLICYTLLMTESLLWLLPLWIFLDWIFQLSRWYSNFL